MKIGLNIKPMRESAVYKNHNPTLYIYSTLAFSFIMDACLGHTFEGTHGITMQLGL
mgnify:FL=1